MGSFSAPRTERKPRYQLMEELCHGCKLKDREAKAEAAQPSPRSMGEVRARQILRAQKAIEAGKEHFRCKRCEREERPHLRISHRYAYDGLCCENGKKEWKESEALLLAGSSLTILGTPIPPANRQPELELPRENTETKIVQGRKEQGESKATGKKERSESKAVDYRPLEKFQTQATSRRSFHLEPRKGIDFSKVPGYVHPTHTTQYGTYYQELGISSERLKSHPRTYHGHFPVTTPPPQKPLPATPEPRTPPSFKQPEAMNAPRRYHPKRRQRSEVMDAKPPRRRSDAVRSLTAYHLAGGQRTEIKDEPMSPRRYYFPEGSTKPPMRSHATPARVLTEPQRPSTPVHQLRSSRGRNSVDFANQSPAVMATKSESHQISGSSRDQSASMRGNQDIGSHRLASPFVEAPYILPPRHSPPRLSAARYSPVSATTNGRFPGDFDEPAMMSRELNVRCPRESSLRLRRDLPTLDLDRAFNDTDGTRDEEMRGRSKEKRS